MLCLPCKHLLVDHTTDGHSYKEAELTGFKTVKSTLLPFFINHKTNRLNMKKTILMLLLFTITIFSSGQIIHLRAYSCATAEYSEIEKCYIWQDNKNCEIVSVIGTHTINIYSPKPLLLSKIIADSTRTINRIEYTHYQCADDSNIICQATICIDKDRNYTIFVKYADYIFAYYCVEINNPENKYTN